MYHDVHVHALIHMLAECHRRRCCCRHAQALGGDGAAADVSVPALLLHGHRRALQRALPQHAPQAAHAQLLVAHLLRSRKTSTLAAVMLASCQTRFSLQV